MSHAEIVLESLRSIGNFNNSIVTIVKMIQEFNKIDLPETHQFAERSPLNEKEWQTSLEKSYILRMTFQRGHTSQ